MKITQQKSSDQKWQDEKGVEIPYNRITPVERLMERQSAKLYKSATAINEKLVEFKAQIQATCAEVFDEYMKAAGNEKATKGNFTWYNFDRSLRIEVSVSERIEFDDLGVMAAKDKLFRYINENVSAKDDFVHQLILDAFETSKGRLDTKRIMQLIRYKTRSKSELYQDAVKDLENAIRRPDSKIYFTISAKDESGKYTLINLNLASI